MMADAAVLLDRLLDLALEEDIGSGDVTSLYFVPAEERAEARIFAKEAGVVAGSEVCEAVFRKVDASLAVERVRKDGDAVAVGDTVLTVGGRTRSILTAERTALNFLQHLSGIATNTRRYADILAGSAARVLDTRKTTPGLRLLEKAAVLAGGGSNHRMGLHDMVMVKDNHLLAEGRLDELQAAIHRVKADRPAIRIELEADKLDQVRAFLTLEGVDVILLDNMATTELREAVALVRKSGKPIQTEASGGVTMATLARIAATGVDFISSGALTHTVKALDFSLELTRVEDTGSPAAG